MSHQSGRGAFPPGRRRPGGRPPAAAPDTSSHTSGSRSQRSVTPTPGPNPVNPQWSQTSEQRERLRLERDRLERIEAADIWDNGTWAELSAIAHGGQRNAMETTPVRLRLNRSQATPSTQSPINPYTGLAYRDNYETPRQGLSRRRQTSPSTHSSTNPYQGVQQADPAGTGTAYGGVGLFPPRTPSQQPSIPSDNDTTPTTVNGGGDIFQQLADHLREQQHQRREEERLRQEREADYQRVIDQLEEDRRAEYRTIHRARLESAIRLRRFNQVRDDQIAAAYRAWFTSIPLDTQNRYIDYSDDCSEGTKSRYQCYRAMLWIDGLPDAVVHAIQRAMDAEKEIDRLSWEGAEAYEGSLGNSDFIPRQRETYPPRSTGEFGDEFVRNKPDEHVCEVGSFCDFIKLHELNLPPGTAHQHSYFLGALHIRMQRVRLARRRIAELGDDANAADRLIFSAFHCWLGVALDYIHRCASPTGHDTIAQEFREAGKDFIFGVEEERTGFEDAFRHEVKFLFSGRKKQHWETRVGYQDRDPLTGQLFDQRGEVNPRLYFPPESFETEDYVVDQSDVPTTPVARSRLMNGLALPRIIRSPRSSPRRSATRTSLPRRSATPTERPRSEREASVSSARSGDLGDDEDMEDEPEIPRRRRRGGRKVSRTARHLPAVAEENEEMEEDDATGDDDDLKEDENMDDDKRQGDDDEIDEDEEAEADLEHEQWEGFEEEAEDEEDEDME